MWGDFPGWVQAIGSAGAIIVAVILWRFDRKREKAAQAILDRERTQRIVAALRAEIRYAVMAAERQWASTKLVMEKLSKRKGIGVKDLGFSRDVLTTTDAIIFRGIASEIGHLPPALVEKVTGFYSYARDVERIAAAQESSIGSLETLSILIPRLRFFGEWTLAMLDRFESNDFIANSDVGIEDHMLFKVAKKVEYPLEDIAKAAEQ